MKPTAQVREVLTCGFLEERVPHKVKGVRKVYLQKGMSRLLTVSAKNLWNVCMRVSQRMLVLIQRWARSGSH